MPIRTEYPHGTFNWVDLMAHDAGAAAAFYTALFGWEARVQDTQGGHPYTMFCNGEHVVAGMGEMGAEMKAAGAPPSWNSYVSVDDLQAVVDKVEELGGKVTMPPMPIMDAGTMAFVADPEGASLALWQPNQHIGATLVNEPGAFSWNELAGREDSTQDFYAGLFGWTFSKLDMGGMGYTLIKSGERDMGGIVHMNEQWGEMPSHWMVYFAVADTDASCKQVEALGGKVCVPPTDIPAGRFSVVEDPQGAVFTLIRLNAAAD